jgi:hypothetical protein
MNENVVEQAALGWFEFLSRDTANGIQRFLGEYLG